MATPFWQPLYGLSLIWVRWLPRIKAEPLLSTRTPYSRLSHGPLPGPVMVNARMLVLFAPATRTIALGLSITAGALIMAAKGVFDLKVRLFFPAGIVTCSTYVPGQTRIVSPEFAAITAA